MEQMVVKLYGILIRISELMRRQSLCMRAFVLLPKREGKQIKEIELPVTLPYQ